MLITVQKTNTEFQVCSPRRKSAVLERVKYMIRDHALYYCLQSAIVRFTVHPCLPSCSVLDHLPYSNHYAVLLSSTSHVPQPPRWCFNRGGWHTFTSLSTLPLPPSFSFTSDMLSYFTMAVLNAAFIAIPRTSRPYTFKCVPWWNTEFFKVLQKK